MRDRTEYNTGYVAIIVNSIPPYAYEVNNILALPSGFAYRCRFRRKWMPTIENPIDLIGRSGLMILRDFNTAEFIPLRRIRISNILEVGEISYIEYALEDIIDLDSHERDRSEQLKKFNKLTNGAISGFDNVAGQDLEQLIFMTSDLAYGIEDNHYEGAERNRPFNSWGNLIQVLGQIDYCYRDFDFFKVVQIVDSRGEVAPVVGHPYPNTARFHLRNDTVYRAQVLQRTFTHLRGEGDSSVLTSRQIALRGEPGEARPIRSTHSIAGKYDLYLFSFKTEPTSRTRDTSLSLEIQRDDIAPPNIDVPIRISVGRTQKLVRGISHVCFVIGIGLLFGADQIGQLTSLQADLLERIGILMAIISSYGAGPFAKSLKSLLERIGVEYQV